MKQINGNVMSQTDDSQSHVQNKRSDDGRRKLWGCIYETDEMNLAYAQQSPPMLEMGNCAQKEPEPTTVLVPNASKTKQNKKVIFMSNVLINESKTEAAGEFAWICYLISRKQERESCVVED